MVRTDGVAVFPVTNAIGTIVQAVERSDVDTVMVAGEIRKRAGKLVDVDLARLRAEVDASRDYLLDASGYRTDLFADRRSRARPPDLARVPPAECRAARRSPLTTWRLSCQQLTAKRGARPDAAPVHLSRPAPAIIAALFCGYLAVGLPLPVLPLFVHDKLGFSNLIVGLVIGVQFLATVLTRGYAGRVTDQQGGKRSALQGACGLRARRPALFRRRCAGPVAGDQPRHRDRSAAWSAGFGESQFVTGCVSWSIASVGPQRAGMSMSWTGIAMFAALAIGAPVGMALYQAYGLEAAMVACIVAPLIAAVIALGATSYMTPGRPAAALLSRDRPDLARRPGPDAAGRRSFRAHGLRLALLRGARLEPCRPGDDRLRHRLHLRAGGARDICPTGSAAIASPCGRWSSRRSGR